LNSAIDEASASGKDLFKNYLLDIKETNSAVFDLGNLFSSVISSEDFANISNDVDGLVNSLGRVSGRNLQ
jgi:hypothetical protein